MKKKLLRRTLIMVIAVVMVFAFSTTAFALYSSNEASWSGSCYNLFTTSDYTQKPYGTWHGVGVGPRSISFSSSVPVVEMKFRPKTSTGYLMSGSYTTGGVLPSCCYHGHATTLNRSFSKMHIVVKNPYSGPRMTSNGYFHGSYQ